MTKELISLNQKDKAHISKLIEIYREGTSVDITVMLLFSIFCILIAVLTIYAESELWYIFFLLLTPPILGTIYTVWKFRQQTFDLRADLKKLKKFIKKAKIVEKGTRTDGWTVPAGVFKYNTIIKSFEYYLKTENYLFLTKEKELFEKYNIDEIVFLEIALNSNIVLGIK